MRPAIPDDWRLLRGLVVLLVACTAVVGAATLWTAVAIPLPLSAGDVARNIATGLVLVAAAVGLSFVWTRQRLVVRVVAGMLALLLAFAVRESVITWRSMESEIAADEAATCTGFDDCVAHARRAFGRDLPLLPTRAEVEGLRLVSGRVGGSEPASMVFDLASNDEEQASHWLAIRRRPLDDEPITGPLVTTPGGRTASEVRTRNGRLIGLIMRDDRFSYAVFADAGPGQDRFHDRAARELLDSVG